ncbi:hypothetical protein AB0N17_44515 [Streptomyces sp. NPDC051133]
MPTPWGVLARGERSPGLEEIDGCITGTLYLFQKRVDEIADIRATVIGK